MWAAQGADAAGSAVASRSLRSCPVVRSTYYSCVFKFTTGADRALIAAFATQRFRLRAKPGYAVQLIALARTAALATLTDPIEAQGWFEDHALPRGRELVLRCGRYPVEDELSALSAMENT